MRWYQPAQLAVPFARLLVAHRRRLHAEGRGDCAHRVRVRREGGRVPVVGEDDLGAFQAGDVPSLRRRHRRDGVTGGDVQGSVDGGFGAVQQEGQVDAVLEDASAGGVHDAGQPFEFAARQAAPRGVPGIAQDEQLGAAREGRLDSLVVEAPQAVLAQGGRYFDDVAIVLVREGEERHVGRGGHDDGRAGRREPVDRDSQSRQDVGREEGPLGGDLPAEVAGPGDGRPDGPFPPFVGDVPEVSPVRASDDEVPHLGGDAQVHLGEPHSDGFGIVRGVREGGPLHGA